jgi:uncharacterized cupin superfamily protein
MNHLFKFDRTDITPETERPDAEIVLAGDPVHTTWSMEEREDEGIYSGMWQTTPGKWKVSYEEWEYVYIHEGVSILTDTEGKATTLRAGDRWLIRPGFEGTWECVETTLKDYVIVMP